VRLGLGRPGLDFAKVKQWEAFIKKGKLDTGGATLEQVCALLHDFLMPPTTALVRDMPFAKVWPAAGPRTP
jgi:hypothetical protein